ncbi:predicted protein [Naegleria gruberi]|uniref:ADP/ATP translocase n=1 Tax=Naegleria gruberi TaxID=5762 RepID=D2VBI1_NAEGR|nr:uncharacterized protein NAEGRDRAFT_66225 [Naegleria gruberi]EFC45802.1 predicted protein [Naegleria gruberi]|eukprot:XP_002678546.1 predicted protein [Naegleria gruberi strain NEG-M]
MSATEMQPKSYPIFAFLRDFSITGGVYFASCTITNPIRGAVFHLGTQDIFSDKPKYTGIINYLVNTVKNNGIRGLWAFNVGIYLREVSGVAFNFAFHASFKKILPQFSPVNNQLEYMLMQFISGGLAVLTTRSFQHPLDFLSTYEYRDLKPGFRACFNGLGDVV